MEAIILFMATLTLSFSLAACNSDDDDIIDSSVNKAPSAPYTRIGFDDLAILQNSIVEKDEDGNVVDFFYGEQLDASNPKHLFIGVFPITKTSSDITLTGSLLGSLEGTFSNPQIVETGGGNSMSGICGTLNTINSLLNGKMTSVNNTYNMMNNKNLPSCMRSAVPYLSAASMGLSITSAILEWAGDETPLKRDTIPGKIDLGLNAAMNLQGVISGYTSHAMGGLNVTPELMEAGNADVTPLTI